MNHSYIDNDEHVVRSNTFGVYKNTSTVHTRFFK